MECLCSVEGVEECVEAIFTAWGWNFVNRKFFFWIKVPWSVDGLPVSHIPNICLQKALKCEIRCLRLERSENVMPVIVGCLVSIVESKRSWSSAVFLRLFIFQLRFLCIALADDSRAVSRDNLSTLIIFILLTQKPRKKNNKRNEKNKKSSPKNRGAEIKFDCFVNYWETSFSSRMSLKRFPLFLDSKRATESWWISEKRPFRAEWERKVFWIHKLGSRRVYLRP